MDKQTEKELITNTVTWFQMTANKLPWSSNYMQRREQPQFTHNLYLYSFTSCHFYGIFLAVKRQAKKKTEIQKNCHRRPNANNNRLTDYFCHSFIHSCNMPFMLLKLKLKIKIKILKQKNCGGECFVFVFLFFIII